MKLHTYTIMPLDVEHIDEICEDIKRQYKENIASCALFKMTLVPEGNPPIDKAKIMCEKYDLFRRRLSAEGISNGVLVQASIGHGWQLSEPFPYQKFTGMRTGEEIEVVCPYDEGFRDYIYNTMRTIALHSPDCIMVDDDFRLIGRGTDGCGCPLHMKRFNELAGTDLTRAELHKLLISDGNEEYKNIYVETQRESLVETAKIMRKGIDSVSKTLPGLFCCVGNNAEFAAEIAKCLAGSGNPTVVRINNGNYIAGGARYLSDAFQRAAAQIAKLKDDVDIILAETDTCPQNRYSTGAMQLHAHYTGTILEGAQGAKQWITRLSAFEPESGKAYRKILARYSKFYEALADITKELTWCGCRIPVNNKAHYEFGKDWAGAPDGSNGWSRCVLERLGLPFYFSADRGGALCLEGDVFLSNDELLKAAEGTVLIASDSAEELIKRGFSKYIGVEIAGLEEKAASIERYNKNNMPIQYGIKRIVPIADGVKELSEVCHTVDFENYEKLFPGVTAYKNELGGLAVVFSGTPKTEYNVVDAFSFLNYTRKSQLVEILLLSGNLPIYYPNDEEVYLRAARTKDGGLFCAVFNLSLDPIEKLELVCESDVSTIEKLMPNGEFEKTEFEKSDGKYVLDTPCNTLEPVVLILR